MAMDLNAKAAYIRGLMTGMEFDADSKNGKVIAAMMDLLEEMAAQVTEHDDALDQVYDELETLDQDVDDIVSDLYADEDDDEEEDDEDDSTMYEVTCPNCGQVSTLDEETLMTRRAILSARIAARPSMSSWKAPRTTPPRRPISRISNFPSHRNSTRPVAKVWPRGGCCFHYIRAHSIGTRTCRPPVPLMPPA